MAQFDVYRLGDTVVVDCQSDLVQQFATRFVIPLLPVDDVPPAIARLTPVLTVDGEARVLATPLAAGVARSALGASVTSLADQGYEIKRAIDFLIGGT